MSNLKSLVKSILAWSFVAGMICALVIAYNWGAYEHLDFLYTVTLIECFMAAGAVTGVFCWFLEMVEE